MDIKNIAIIAHVDHGKTTLVDALFQASIFQGKHQHVQERAMDSDTIERERGITILSKNTAIMYNDHKINILDTPGHVDFGGEVERIMDMVDGVLLVVDACDGVMPQTKTVLLQALKRDIVPIVVINKIDRDVARPEETLNQVYDLFLELGASDKQLDFPYVFCSAIKKKASYEPVLREDDDMGVLLDVIVKEVPSPDVDPNGPLLFQPSLLDYNDYVGRMGIGLIHRGVMHVGDEVICVRKNGDEERFRIQKITGYLGLEKRDLQEAYAGDVVAISGLSDIYVGETVCSPERIETLPPIEIKEPTVKMLFSTNTSPFAGRSDTYVTSPKIDERLHRETQRDLALKVHRIENKDQWIVSGRGQLHLSILIENMRRESYEFQVSRPQVIEKVIDGITKEPYEHVWIDIEHEHVGAVMEYCGERNGKLLDMGKTDTRTKLTYEMPSRNLIGFMTGFRTLTKGYGVVSHSFWAYKKKRGETHSYRETGALVASCDGVSTHYALAGLEDCGVLFIPPKTEVYEGMIVGEHNKPNNLAVNVTKKKKLTNVRAAAKDDTIVLKRYQDMDLEACLDFITDDEYVEVTPADIRMRKTILNTKARLKSDR